MKTREQILRETIVAMKDNNFKMAKIYCREGDEKQAYEYDARAFELMTIIRLLDSDDFLANMYDVFFSDDFKD